MATQMQKAREGKITKDMEIVAQDEGMNLDTLVALMAEGKIVIPHNISHTNLVPRGIGEGLTTKVNANIGTSSVYTDINVELEKLKIAIDAGADSIMDLSTGGDINKSRKEIISHSSVMVGTVPLYQATVEGILKYREVRKISAEDFLETIRCQAKDGADFMTLHVGITQKTLSVLEREGRVMDIVSRGGSFIASWMLANDRENPLYEHFDDILDICEEYDVTLSLGDGIRPGCLLDATDRGQISELITLGELVERAWKRGVSVIVEGPGHVPLTQIETNVALAKKICHQAPFYVLGPLVTDIAPCYDHITSAIGGAIAAAKGVDFLCYVTPAEHLALPTAEDVHTGVIAARIAAHAGDIGKGIKGAIEWDRKMAQARKKLDWEKQLSLAIDPKRARTKRSERNDQGEEACSMCGKYCAVQILEEYMRGK